MTTQTNRLPPRYSTATGAQHVRILQALTRRPHTSYELRKLGCYHCPARIAELRRMGYDIHPGRVSIWDDEGYRHDGIALYTLHGAAYAGQCNPASAKLTDFALLESSMKRSIPPAQYFQTRIPPNDHDGANSEM